MKFTALSLLGLCLSLNALNAAQVTKEGDHDYQSFSLIRPSHTFI